MLKNTKTVGSIFLVAGTIIGGAVLSLPIISAGMGFLYTSLLMLVMWFVATVSSLIILEVNLSFPHGSSFNTMAYGTLGRVGQIINNFCFLLLLYALTAAYISGGAALISSSLKIFFNFTLHNTYAAILFTLTFGSCVYWGTHAVDYINRFFFTFKIIVYTVAVITILPYVHTEHLIIPHDGHKYILAAIPIFLTLFGFQGSIPSIVNYIGYDVKKLKNIFIIGTIIPLVIYFLWAFTTLSLLPRTGAVSFASIVAHSGSSTIGAFLEKINRLEHNKFLTTTLGLFSDIAVVTSFLGVTIGLFDFIADTLKRKNNRHHRLQTALVTFLPPIIFALIYPQGFILALGYAAIALAILALIMPALMAYVLRKQNRISIYKVAGGNFTLCLFFLIGCIIVLLQLASNFNLLPVF